MYIQDLILDDVTWLGNEHLQKNPTYLREHRNLHPELIWVYYFSPSSPFLTETSTGKGLAAARISPKSLHWDAINLSLFSSNRLEKTCCFKSECRLGCVIATQIMYKGRNWMTGKGGRGCLFVLHLFYIALLYKKMYRQFVWFAG